MGNRLTDTELGEIEDRCTAATESPWSMVTSRDVYSIVVAPAHVVAMDFGRDADAEFTAHAREDVPALVADLRKARRLLAEFVDAGDASECRFDHHGDCQEHGHCDIEPGRKCPTVEAREYLAEVESDA